MRGRIGGVLQCGTMGGGGALKDVSHRFYTAWTAAVGTTASVQICTKLLI